MASVAASQLHKRQARSALVTGLVLFAATQAGLAVVIDSRRPELRDVEFGWKIVRLRQLVAAEPDRPLAVMLGSSRTAYGFKGEEYRAALAARGRAVLAYNLGVSNGGPVRQVSCLKHLLRHEKKPALVVAEVFPLFLRAEPVNVPALSWQDMVDAGKYLPDPRRARWDWALSRLTGWYAHRFLILGRVSKSWLPRGEGVDVLEFLHRTDRTGWVRPRPDWTPLPPEVRKVRFAACPLFQDAYDHFSISRQARRALTDLVRRCRQEAIPVVLVLMPEPSELRGWNTPHTEAEVQAFLGGLRQEGATLLDGRRWLGDEHFWDTHHTVASGARRFTALLAEKTAPLLGSPPR
jgi:hypothetical protein